MSELSDLAARLRNVADWLSIVVPTRVADLYEAADLIEAADWIVAVHTTRARLDTELDEAIAALTATPDPQPPTPPPRYP